MYYLLLSIFLVICVLLMVVILLQQSKGGGLSGAFGGMGGGEAMFGARGVTTFLHKATIYLGAAFMVISLTLALILMNSRSGGSSLATEAGRRGGDVLSAPVVEDLSVPAGATQEGNDELVPQAPADDANEGGGDAGSGGN